MPFAVGLVYPSLGLQPPPSRRAHPTRVCLQLATIAAFAQNANMLASRQSKKPSPCGLWFRPSRTCAQRGRGAGPSRSSGGSSAAPGCREEELEHFALVSVA